MSDFTRILQAVDGGDLSQINELIPLVYDELRTLAAQKMAREVPGQTLQATALVHEAWLRLAGAESEKRWQNRAHFFGAAAEAMRRILIERARKKAALKRGARPVRVDLSSVDGAETADGDTLIEVDEALKKLATEDPEAAELIKLRFFVGMTNEEAASALGISDRTAKRNWTYARAWLFREIQRQRKD